MTVHPLVSDCSSRTELFRTRAGSAPWGRQLLSVKVASAFPSELFRIIFFAIQFNNVRQARRAGFQTRAGGFNHRQSAGNQSLEPDCHVPRRSLGSRNDNLNCFFVSFASLVVFLIPSLSTHRGISTKVGAI